MKKIIYMIGAFVSIAAIFAAIAVMLKKLKISLSIEGIDDEMEGEDVNHDIDLSIENYDIPEFDETGDAFEEALEELLSEEASDEIEVEIREE